MKNKKIKLIIFTVARSDFGIISNFLKKIQNDKRFGVYLLKGPAHSSNLFGMTQSEIKQKKIKKIINYNFKYKNSDESSIAKYFSLFFLNNIKIIKKIKPNGAVILGDRYEMLANALSCLNLNIPIFHFCGGSKTLGSLDDTYRNCISLMSNVHFLETNNHKENLIKMGIKNNLYVVGAPALENVKLDINDFEKVCKNFKLVLDKKKKLIICSFHPETTNTLINNVKKLNILLSFLISTNQNIIFTYPNADLGYRKYIKIIKTKFKNKKNIFLIKNLGKNNYYSILNNADLMIGNSSSGIIESASFGLPVLNVGERQKNRFKANNVLNSRLTNNSLINTYKLAISKKFVIKCKKIKNPYEKKNTSKSSVEIIYKYLKFTR